MEDFIRPKDDSKAYYRQQAYYKRHGIPRLRTCKICGKQFEINVHCHTYCSKDCAAEALRRHKESLLVKEAKSYTKTCKFCGKSFVAHFAHKNYCSKKCANGAANKLRREKRWSEAGLTCGEEVTCAYCHKPFTPKFLGHRFCSNKCCQAYRSCNGDITEREAKMTHTRVCPWCGKEFTTIYVRQKYCTFDCQVGYLTHGKVSKADYLSEKERKRAERQAAREAQAALRPRSERENVSTHGLTFSQVAEVVAAQDGDPSKLWKLSQGWTEGQRKFAKKRYCYIHGI